MHGKVVSLKTWLSFFEATASVQGHICNCTPLNVCNSSSVSSKPLVLEDPSLSIAVSLIVSGDVMYFGPDKPSNLSMRETMSSYVSKAILIIEQDSKRESS